MINSATGQVSSKYIEMTNVQIKAEIKKIAKIMNVKPRAYGNKLVLCNRLRHMRMALIHFWNKGNKDGALREVGEHPGQQIR